MRDEDFHGLNLFYLKFLDNLPLNTLVRRGFDEQKQVAEDELSRDG
jgi:hypothetical protein